MRKREILKNGILVVLVISTVLIIKCHLVPCLYALCYCNLFLLFQKISHCPLRFFALDLPPLSRNQSQLLFNFPTYY